MRINDNLRILSFLFYTERTYADLLLQVYGILSKAAPGVSRPGGTPFYYDQSRRSSIYSDRGISGSWSPRFRRTAGYGCPYDT